METPTVDRVLEMIEAMPDQDRIALEQRLSERLEKEWKETVAENRRIASERGLSEQAIDRAIHRRRYGE